MESLPSREREKERRVEGEGKKYVVFIPTHDIQKLPRLPVPKLPDIMSK